jgi:hypothetical protein
VSPGKRLALLAGVVTVAALCIVAAVGWRWWSGLLETARAGRDAGIAFGESHNHEECVTRALQRYKADPGFASAVSARLFLHACLVNGRPVPGFCAGVPSPKQIGASASWRVGRCRAIGISDNFCHQVLAPVQEFCGWERPPEAGEPTSSK